MTDQTTTSITEADEEGVSVMDTPTDDGVTPNQPDEDTLPDAGKRVDQGEEPETFPAEYVRKLREEAAEHRVKAKDRDEIARRLHSALVAADGRLVAPEELPFDETHLSDPQALADAIGALVTAKPYLAARRLRGDVGQGERRGTDGDVNLAGILRARA